MFHLFDRYDPSYRFAEVAALQLMRSTQPTNRAATGEAQHKLLQAFTVLVHEMQEVATEYFDDTAATPHLTVANPRATTQTQLRQTFDGSLQPLFRSCSLLEPVRKVGIWCRIR
jgi:DNA anti-recombination protein RmuC